jgi:hypothetical protein
MTEQDVSWTLADFDTSERDAILADIADLQRRLDQRERDLKTALAAITPPPIHVDYRPDHEQCAQPLTTNEPILHYRVFSTTGVRVRDPQTGRSRRLLDGWVLAYEASWCDSWREEGEPPGERGDNPDEYITGIEELTAVDEAVAAAQRHLLDIGYRGEP